MHAATHTLNVNADPLVFNGREIPTDHEGYLLDPDDWSPELAGVIGEREGLALNAERWEVVEFVRVWFEENQSVPELRKLLQALKQRHGKERATRRYVYGLFPYGFGQQACKMAGMRKPLKLMLDL